MKRILLAPLVFATAVARPGVAAESGGKACGDFIASAQESCILLKEATASLRDLRAKLAAVAADADSAVKAAAAKAVEDTEARIAAAEARPTSKICEALEGVRSAESCVRLATLLSGDLDMPASAAADETVAVAQQADRQTASNKSGSSAQLDPVESVQPITLAGGAISLAGTRAGTMGVGTITVNPLALTRPQEAYLSRLFDLSVSAPFELDAGTGEDRRYVSVRLRANMTAPFSAKPLQAALKAYRSKQGEVADQLVGILERATDLPRCANSILLTNAVSAQACGETLEAAALRDLRTKTYAEIARARREADSYYFGLDARFDNGDPSGVEIPGDKGTHLLGGLAGGLRIPQGSLWDWEVRGRAAGDYFRSRDDSIGNDPKSVYSFDWGVAFILSGRLEEEAKQKLAFGIGVEGRQATTGDDIEFAPTNYTNLNLMAVVPAASGADIGIAISIPMEDRNVPRGTVVSFSTDLGLIDRSGGAN